MRLRAIDLPRHDSYVFVLDDVDRDAMEALLLTESQVGLEAKAREWGATGFLVFSAPVVLDEEISPSGLPQIRVALEEAVAAGGGDVVWTEPEERR